MFYAGVTGVLIRFKKALKKKNTETIPPHSWFCWKIPGGNYSFWALRSGPFLWTPLLFLLFLVSNRAQESLSDYRANRLHMWVKNCSGVDLKFLKNFFPSQEWTLKTQSLSGWIRSCLRYKHFRRWSSGSDRCAWMPQSSPVWNASWRSKQVSAVVRIVQKSYLSKIKEKHCFGKSGSHPHEEYLSKSLKVTDIKWTWASQAKEKVRYTYTQIL